MFIMKLTIIFEQYDTSQEPMEPKPQPQPQPPSHPTYHPSRFPSYGHGFDVGHSIHLGLPQPSTSTHMDHLCHLSLHSPHHQIPCTYNFLPSPLGTFSTPPNIFGTSAFTPPSTYNPTWFMHYRPTMPSPGSHNEANNHDDKHIHDDPLSPPLSSDHHPHEDLDNKYEDHIVARLLINNLLPIMQLFIFILYLVMNLTNLSSYN